MPSTHQMHRERCLSVLHWQGIQQLFLPFFIGMDLVFLATGASLFLAEDDIDVGGAPCAVADMGVCGGLAGGRTSDVYGVGVVIERSGGSTGGTSTLR